MPAKSVKIFEKGEKILRQNAKEVAAEEIKSRNIREIIRKMNQAISENEEAIAIAAPQIGENLRIFLVSEWTLSAKTEKPKTDFKNIVFINPKIIKVSREKKLMPEGCLSTPGLYGSVKRSGKVKIEARNEDGKKFIRGASGLFAQAIQHEMDHLNGILFIDKAANLIKSPPQKAPEI